MTYEELKEKASPAVKEVARMGIWDAVHLDKEDGEPVVIAVLRERPLKKLLLNLGIMKKPNLPERIQGIRCKLLIVNAATRNK